MNGMQFGKASRGSSDFITEWHTSGASESIVLPLITGIYTYDFMVDYGDDSGLKTVTAWDDADATHEYDDAGDYIVTISGTCEAWSFNNAGDRLKIIDVSNWGDVGFTYLNGAFYGCSNLYTTATDAGAFGSVTDVGGMFRDAVLVNPNTSSWDLGTAWSFYAMFYGAIAADPDTSFWDTSSATNMEFVFYGATSADPDVTDWDVSGVTSMEFMFYGATSADPYVADWVTTLVENMQYMFCNATALNPDISGWNTGVVANMDYMFYGATLANPDVSGLDVADVATMDFMFYSSAFSDTNYDLLLDAWEHQSLQSDVPFHAGTAKYTKTAAKLVLTDTYNWAITDGGSA